MNDQYYVQVCSFCGRSGIGGEATLNGATVLMANTRAAICDICVKAMAAQIADMPSKPATANWPHGSMGEYVEGG